MKQGWVGSITAGANPPKEEVAKLGKEPLEMAAGDGRGRGRTTAQMMGAPYGAIYVVPGGPGISYFRALAIFLERADLSIVGQDWLTGERRERRHPVMIDHYIVEEDHD